MFSIFIFLNDKNRKLVDSQVFFVSSQFFFSWEIWLFVCSLTVLEIINIFCVLAHSNGSLPPSMHIMHFSVCVCLIEALSLSLCLIRVHVFWFWSVYITSSATHEIGWCPHAEQRAILTKKQLIKSYALIFNFKLLLNLPVYTYVCLPRIIYVSFFLSRKTWVN